MGRYKPRAPLSLVQQLRLRYQLSPLTGPHALAKRSVNRPEDTRSALQLLQDCFLPRFQAPPHQQQQEATSKQLQDLAPSIAAQSTPGTLVVPNPRHSRLPRHVLANDRPQPWQLLPMRAAAMQQYPDFFGQSCQFFSSIHTAILKGAATQLLRPSKLNLDLAKTMRNLGIIAGFEVIQRIEKCKDSDLIWPQGTEPEHHLDLALYPYLWLRLDIRWDAHRPVWLASGTTNAPMHTHEPVPSSVVLVSRPSKPVLMTPREVQLAAEKWPTGVLFMYHPYLGIITDVEAAHYGWPALAMAQVALPWAQVAQIRGLLRAKVQRESAQQKTLRTPLQDWSLVEHVKQTLEERAQMLSRGSDIQGQQRALEREAKEEQAANEDLARRARDEGNQIREELLALRLAPKLGLKESTQAVAAAVAAPAVSVGAGRGMGGGGGGADRRGR